MATLSAKVSDARVLPTEFYRRPTRQVARDLIGKRLVHILDGVRVSGLIVETEAYLGVKDAAAHSFGDRRTARTQSMYLDSGHAYVYLIYGMHFCFNVVTRSAGVPEAVLIRALQPESDAAGMYARRRLAPTAKPSALCSGPGKVCQALGLTRQHNGQSLLSSTLFIEEAKDFRPAAIARAPRIGVDYAGEAARWPLRYMLKNNPHVSVRPPS